MDGPPCYCLDIRVLMQDGSWIDRIKLKISRRRGGQFLDGKTFSTTGTQADQLQSRVYCNDELISGDRELNELGSLPSYLGSLHMEAASAEPDKHSQQAEAHCKTNTLTNEWHHPAIAPTQEASNPSSVASPEYHKRFKLRVALDPILASCLASELNRSEAYRETFTGNLVCGCASQERWKGGMKGAIRIKLIVSLTDSSLFSMEPDIRWSKRMLPMWLLRISLDDAFSWLSTLGGAFSALGDESMRFAEKAGQVSVRQMKLALQIGDPILQARCMVYLAQSLMQKGSFRTAMCIVRKQYQFALSLGESTDQRLINMCRGVWSILQYWHQRRREHKKKCMGLYHQHRTSPSFAR